MSTQLSPQEVIMLKRDGSEVSYEILKNFFEQYLRHEIKDYQVSAFLMAAFLKGLSTVETANLTRVMIESGISLNWPVDKNLLVDKHSTGGVGDKTSLVILPLCALEGVFVPMMAGRGLGFTGGTIDKLESIPGMNCFPEVKLAQEILQAHGGVFMAQSKQVATLDGELYALRDVTGTVESIPLITASILSKKVAEGIRHLVMDIKFGSGAFMKTLPDARALARSIKNTGEALGLQVRCFLTDMNSVLGTHAGNALEITEVLEILKGQGPEDTTQLSIDLAEQMIALANGNNKGNLNDHLKSGRAWHKFNAIISAQGGSLEKFHESVKNSAVETTVIPTLKSGFIQKINVEKIGQMIVKLGGGRLTREQVIDPHVGLSNVKRIGAEMTGSEELLTVHHRKGQVDGKFIDEIQSCFDIEPQAVPISKLIAEVL